LILSTLTKILIVLLTVSSVFLCGIIVTYVANAQDYRQTADWLNDNVRDLQRDKRELNEKVTELTAKSDSLQTRLNKEVATLRTRITELTADLRDAERKKDQYFQEVKDMGAAVESLSQTAKHQTDLYKSTQAELLQVKADLTNEQAEFEALAKNLEAKLAIIATLEAEKRQLQEQLADLQTKLDQLVRDFGREPVRPKPITRLPLEKAKPAPPIVKKVELKALITDLDAQNSFAEVSIGASRGVKEGMRFFVTREAEFICEILIIDVDAEKSVGILERVQSPPKIGDEVSTSLGS
jgi:uncharacterized protein YoxC